MPGCSLKPLVRCASCERIVAGEFFSLQRIRSFFMQWQTTVPTLPTVFRLVVLRSSPLVMERIHIISDVDLSHVETGRGMIRTSGPRNQFRQKADCFQHLTSSKVLSVFHLGSFSSLTTWTSTDGSVDSSSQWYTSTMNLHHARESNRWRCCA